jgi:hypothetical protein
VGEPLAVHPPHRPGTLLAHDFRGTIRPGVEKFATRDARLSRRTMNFALPESTREITDNQFCARR